MYDHGKKWFGLARDLRPYPKYAVAYDPGEMWTWKDELAPLSSHVKRYHMIWRCVGCNGEVPRPTVEPQQCHHCGLMYNSLYDSLVFWSNTVYVWKPKEEGNG